MSQNDFTLANQSFPAFRADLNSALQALASNNSGTSAPSTTFANMWWYDSTNNIMYIRNEDNDAWIKFAELDQTNDKFVLSGTLQLDDGTVSAPALTFNSDTNMGIYRGGTDILKFVTAGTDAITIDASQNVGISTVPSTWSAFTGSLQIDGASFSGLGANNTALGSNAYYNGAWKYYGTGSASLYQQNAGEHRWDIAGSGTADNNTNFSTAMKIANNGDISFYEDTGITPKMVWKSSDERLGIGNSSPTNKLEISATSTDYGMLINNTSTGNPARIVFTNSEGSGYIDQNNNLLRFAQSGDTDVAIDSSGNLLVGTTNTIPGAGNTAVGASIYNDGRIFLSKSANTVASFNRNTSDGSIAEFRKDGSTVGSIGVVASDILYLANPDGTGVGLNFDGDSPKINPTNGTGSGTDGVADLGNSSGRFKDLYLSGGVYLGGTGSANYLSDYEEGTWTPALTRGTTNPTLTYNYQSGHYVKVGSLVTVFFNIYVNTVTSYGTGNNYIGGLPFTVTSNANFRAGGVIAFNSTFITTSAEGLRPQTSVGLDRLNLIIQTLDSTSAAAVLDVSIASSSFIQGSITYQTDA